MTNPVEQRVPAASGQSRPRCLLLHPSGIPVGAGVAQSMLRRHPELAFRAIGHAWAPLVEHDTVVTVTTATPRRGDLVLCEVEGRLDLMRWLGHAAGRCALALDTVPGASLELPAERVLGVVASPAARLGPLARRAYPVASRVAAVRWWWSAVRRDYVFDEPAEGIRSRYAHEAADYAAHALAPPSEAHLALWPRCFAPGSSILVGGCGAGWESIALAMRGHRVLGVDFVPEMIDAARRTASSAGVVASFEVADLAEFEWKGPRFDGVLLTAHLLTYVAGRDRRIEILRRVRAALEPRGCVLFSCRMIRTPEQVLRAILRYALERARGRAAEFGDWHSTSIDADGTVRSTFSRTFTESQLRREVLAAGFTEFRREPHRHFTARHG